jgi:hypothetical protein
MTHHHKDRRLEWWLAINTAFFGVFIAAAWQSMDSAAYDVLRTWLTETNWGLLFVVTGFCHAVALGINGRAWWTPFVRTAATSANALIYASFAAGFWAMDPKSTAVWIYSSLSVAALICIYGAVKDVVHVWGAWRDSK